MKRHHKIEFWSHTQFHFLNGLMRSLQELGWDAKECFHISDTSYRNSKTLLQRIILRIRMFLIHPLLLSLRLLTNRRPAILVVTSNPFFAPLIALIVRSRRNHRVVHLVYDLYPDALAHARAIKTGSLPWKTLKLVRNIMLRNCDATVLLGKRLQAHILQEEPRTANSIVIPVGADDFESGKAEGRSQGACWILYCGNMGYMHDVATLAEALKPPLLPSHRPLHIRIHAGGTRVNMLREQAKQAETEGILSFGGHLKNGDWHRTMAESQVALVTMAKGSEEVVMPSKTYSALAAGQAILAITPRGSDLEDLVSLHQCGWVVTTGDSAALRQILKEIADHPETVETFGKNARQAFLENYSPEKLALRWQTLFLDLIATENHP